MSLGEERDAGTCAESSSESIKKSGMLLNSCFLDDLPLLLVFFVCSRLGIDITDEYRLVYCSSPYSVREHLYGFED